MRYFVFQTVSSRIFDFFPVFFSHIRLYLTFFLPAIHIILLWSSFLIFHFFQFFSFVTFLYCLVFPFSFHFLFLLSCFLTSLFFVTVDFSCILIIFSHSVLSSILQFEISRVWQTKKKCKGWLYFISITFRKWRFSAVFN